jgi:hypothetical protein
MQHLKDVLLSIGYSYQEADRELNDLTKRHDQKWFTSIDKDKDYQEKCDKLLDKKETKKK